MKKGKKLKLKMTPKKGPKPGPGQKRCKPKP
jgi:hypothetical protein